MRGNKSKTTLKLLVKRWLSPSSLGWLQVLDRPKPIHPVMLVLLCVYILEEEEEAEALEHTDWELGPLSSWRHGLLFSIASLPLRGLLRSFLRSASTSSSSFRIGLDMAECRRWRREGGRTICHKGHACLLMEKLAWCWGAKARKRKASSKARDWQLMEGIQNEESSLLTTAKVFVTKLFEGYRSNKDHFV